MRGENAAADRFTIRSVRDDDETAILDLFAKSFHLPRSREHFDWKYRRSPFGGGRITEAFDSDGTLVGHYAGYPVPFRDSHGDFLANQIGDTMTSAAIRHVGRGPTSVLGRTALRFYEDFCEEKVAFNFGFNVANIQKFSLRFLRSDRVEPVPYRVRDLRVHPLQSMRRLDRLARGYRVELVRSVDGEWSRFFERVWRDYEFLVRRDADWVRWRYLDCPDVEYVVVAIRKWGELAGWSVFRVRENRLTWGDALFDRHWPDAVEILLGQVVPLFGVDVVDGWFPPRPAWFSAILADLHFGTAPEPQDLSLMCVPFERTDAVSEMRRSLYYTAGDGDLF